MLISQNPYHSARKLSFKKVIIDYDSFNALKPPEEGKKAIKEAEKAKSEDLISMSENKGYDFFLSGKNEEIDDGVFMNMFELTATYGQYTDTSKMPISGNVLIPINSREITKMAARAKINIKNQINNAQK